MSRSYIDKNKQTNTYNHNSEVNKKKIDPVAQLKWLNDLKVDRGWGIYGDNGETVQMLYEKEKTISKDTDPPIESNNGSKINENPYLNDIDTNQSLDRRVKANDGSKIKENPYLFENKISKSQLGIEVVGKEKHVKKFIEILNSITGNTYSWSPETKILTRTSKLNTETNKNISGELSQLIDEAIASSKLGSISLVKNSDMVLFDNFNTSEVDIGDISKSKDNAFAAGQIAHFIKERLETSGEGGYANEKNRTHENYKQAHEKALVTEGSVVTSMLGIPNAKRIDKEKIEPNSINTEYQYNIISNYGEAAYKYSHSMNAEFIKNENEKLKIDTSKPIGIGGNILSPIKRIK